MDPPHRPRKRARVACTWCHERKVRCDVSIRGNPCTNCRLDSHQCNVRSTGSKARAAGYYLSSADIRPSSAVAQCQPDLNDPSLPTDGIITDAAISRPTDTLNQNPGMQDLRQDRISIEEFVGYTPQVPRNILHTSLDEPQTQGSGVIFSFHRFLELKDLLELPVEDVKYLEMKGCLHVPTGAILDEFVRQYFLHVHPCLPVLNEADFWDLYNNRIDQSRRLQSISLFTFQAMLFASCGFVPSHMVKSIGFPDKRTARNILHNRAKLLFDLKAENDALSKAQGAVLLTYQSSIIVPHAGTLWLTIAIQNAMLFGAHLYHKISRDDPSRALKKRLWWSVILRDRILPLGLRRPLQITPQQFELDLDYMDEDDLQEEIHNSRVYSAGTKRSLALILNFQCRLALILTSVILTVYAPSSLPQTKKTTEQEFMRSLDHLKDIRSTLRAWSDKAKAALPPTSCADGIHESVTLYSDLSFMYYNAARAALCHFETFIVEAHQEYGQDTRYERLEGIKNELEDAALGTTKRVQHLLRRGIARNLPISAVAYTAFPLVLNALDAKFSQSSSESTARKSLFRYYAQIMELYRKRYDGTDAVALCIQQMLQFVESEKPRVTVYMDKIDTTDPPTSNGTKNWSDIFINQPRFYLRLTLTLDMAISQGQYPRDSDLPALVRELPMKGKTRAACDISSGDSQLEPLDEPCLQQSEDDTNILTQATTSTDDGTDITPPSPAAENFRIDEPLFTDNHIKWESPLLSAQPEFSRGDPTAQQQAFHDVNLDFLDLQNPSFTGADNPVGQQESDITEPNWSDAMLDEILGAISA